MPSHQIRVRRNYNAVVFKDGHIPADLIPLKITVTDNLTYAHGWREQDGTKIDEVRESGTDKVLSRYVNGVKEI